ncbi:GntR family transcriptional regulator [Sodalis sp. dw_96]|uniref:GntR family transcriptional regulator n=1 Tax=Sodalis sp. dw_96 TaxID=2719794 RepID=UPI001BD6B19C|nr:GntR family transcriptional regulator [Sodalis sp. dw_96]
MKVKSNRLAALATPAKIPLYQKMKENLVQRVLSGEWRPGELVPSETALANEYSVSVGTARKAIEQLAQERLVVRQRGRGTTIATNRGGGIKPFRFLKFYSRDDVRTEESVYLESTQGKASAQEAKSFGIEVGAPVARMIRLRAANQTPMLIERATIREDVCPKASQLITLHRPVSISSFLDRMFNILIMRIDEKICAALADDQDIRHLGAAPGEPVLAVERLSYDLAGRLIQISQLHVCKEAYYATSTK